VAGAGPLAPIIVGGFNKPGLQAGSVTPPDTTGAIGPTRYIQLVNRQAGIFNRTTGVIIGSGTLKELANIAPVNSFDPQIIWDPTSNRFYYVMVSIFNAVSDNRLSYGFSKTASPSNVTTDWCHYTLSFGARFPDFPKLGDSALFVIIGVNSFNSSDNFLGSDLIAISKPPAGTVCPAVSSFKIGTKLNLLDSTGAKVFTPVPANQIDTNGIAYVVARNGALPSNKLWFFNVSQGVTGLPVFGAARGVTVGSYAIPADASQPGFAQVLLDTSDARNTQAVQAVDPRLNKFAFWTLHTINSLNASTVRWYEIDPVPAAPVVLRSANISFSNNPTFFFNAAISPDRRVDVATTAFGNSFVIEYNVSSRVSNVGPSIVAGSSVNGGALSFLLVKADGPYRDFTCVEAGSTCRWGDYSSATP
jgi:hypothetical protein